MTFRANCAINRTSPNTFENYTHTLPTSLPKQSKIQNCVLRRVGSSESLYTTLVKREHDHPKDSDHNFAFPSDS